MTISAELCKQLQEIGVMDAAAGVCGETEFLDTEASDAAIVPVPDD
jgi:hypothetical protein